MGSKHRVKRFRIDIEKISSVKADEIQDPVVSYKVNGVN